MYSNGRIRNSTPQKNFPNSPAPPWWAPDPPMVGIRSPIGLVVGSCTSHPGVLGSIPKREEPGKTGAPCVKVPGSSRVPGEGIAVMARRRRRRPPGGQTTAAGSGRRRAPFSTDNGSHTHTARSLACPLLTLSSARPFSNGIFRSDGAPASLPPASSSLTHARRMDGFCNQNADQLGYLAGPSRLTVYVGVVECAPASPYTYSSSTHRFPDERTPIEATPLSATSAELGLGLGLGLGLD